MTTGWVVVVVGGVVVVVVVVGEVGDGAPPPEGTPLPVEPEMAGAVVLVVLVEVVGAGVTGGTVLGDGADEPGCSLATMTPMNAVAPPATSTANLVSRLTRSCARGGRPAKRRLGRASRCRGAVHIDRHTCVQGVHCSAPGYAGNLKNR